MAIERGGSHQWLASVAAKAKIEAIACRWTNQSSCRLLSSNNYNTIIIIIISLKTSILSIHCARIVPSGTLIESMEEHTLIEVIDWQVSQVVSKLAKSEFVLVRVILVALARWKAPWHTTANCKSAASPDIRPSE